MGKFDGYLICSDMDGTFAHGDLGNDNIDAVHYYISEGGKFTFATGRTANHLKEKGLLPIINAPACLFNGSVVYDYATEQVLRERRLAFSVETFFDVIRELLPNIKAFNVFCDVTDDSVAFTSPEELSTSLLAAHPLKMLCRFEDPDTATAFQQKVTELPFFKTAFIGKSWPVGVEFNPIDGTKGQALQFIKAHLGSIHTAVGIGDYENDLPLLQGADLAVATANAIPAVQQAAHMVVRHYKEFAIKDLIERLEKR